MAEAAQEVDPLDAAVAELENQPPDDEETLESTSEDEESTEDEPELEAEGESEEESEEEEAPEASASDRAKAKGSPLFRKILDKYGGDEDKLADAIVHGWNSGSEQHKRIQQLERELEALKTAKPEAPKEPPIEVTEVQEDIDALNAEAQTNQQEMSRLLKEMDTKNATIYKLQGKMENAEDFDKQALRTEEASHKRDLASLVREYRDYEKSNKRLERDYVRAQRRLERAQKQAEADRAQTATQEVQRAQVRVDTLRDFTDAMEEAQAKYGFPNPERVNKMMRNEVTSYIDSLLKTDPEHPGIDIKAYTAKVVAEYAAEIGVVASKKFAASSKTKAASLAKGKPGTGGAPARPSKVPKTGDEARAHAERILG